MNEIKDVIESMLMVSPETLSIIVGGTVLFTASITGTLKIHGWNKLYVTMGVYVTLFLIYIFKDNEIVRWITTIAVGFGSATGLYQIRPSKGMQQKITGGQTPIDPEFMSKEV